MTKCPECGGQLVNTVEGSTLIVSCKNCNWSVATTYISPIDADETLYSIALTKNNEMTVDQLKLISKMIGGNFLNAKRAINDSSVIITKAKAKTVAEARKKMDAVGLKYQITPAFPH